MNGCKVSYNMTFEFLVCIISFFKLPFQSNFSVRPFPYIDFVSSMHLYCDTVIWTNVQILSAPFFTCRNTSFVISHTEMGLVGEQYVTLIVLYLISMSSIPASFDLLCQRNMHFWPSFMYTTIWKPISSISYCLL